MTTQPPIRLALVGAGLFAREAYLPSLKALGDTFQLVAVCSRRLSSAEDLAKQYPGEVKSYDDLAALLAKEDCEAVALVVPIDTMPAGVEQALSAGKHVISEKPASPDVATGRRLLKHYASCPDQVWMVAENWRYEVAFVQAAEIIRQGEIGRPLLADWTLHISLAPGNPYYHTAWRRSGTFPGGFLLDGGVHQIAGFRMILGEIAQVSAAMAQMRPDLPPADTLSAVLVFDSGAIGSYTITYAHGSPWPSPLRIVGESGALAVENHILEITVGETTRRIGTPAYQGVQKELAAFAAAIRQGQPHVNAPQQGVQDVAVIEALLRAAETGQRTSPERIGA